MRQPSVQRGAPKYKTLIALSWPMWVVGLVVGLAPPTLE